MKLTKEMIFGFSGSVLSSKFDEAKQTPQCHIEWWDLCCSDETMVAIAAPRGFAKSTAITHCYTLASVLFKDRRFVLLISDTYEQAVLFLKEIYSELLDNELLQEMFGKVTFLKDSENDIICQMEDGSKFRIMAKGSEQKVRGLRWDGVRPDLIVGDDLENDEIVMNKERREKFKHWFYSALLPCRSDRGIIRIVGTILHMDSLLENFMPKNWDKKNVIIEDLKISATRKIGGWTSVKYRAHNADFSKLLWKDKRSKEWLLSERQKYIDQGMPEKYSQEYLNEPIDDTNAFFRREDFLPMGEMDLKKVKTMYMAVDFAISETSRADYTVIVCGGVDEEGFLHIVDIIRERMDAKQIVDAIFAMAKRYEPNIITLEAGAIEKALGPYIRAEMFKPNMPFLPLNPLVPTKDKESRATSIQARMRAGGVKFNKETDWYPELESEMRQFPRSVHDDQVDAMAWLGLTLNKMANALTEEELAEEEYDREYQFTMIPQGQSRVTGY